VPGLSGEDPNGSGDITGVKTARDLGNADDYQAATIAMLKQQQELYKSGLKAIEDYLAKITSAKVNRAGSTESARTVRTNDTSSHPGARGDLLSTPEKVKEHLEFVRRERKKAEEHLQLQAELERERKALWDAQVAAARRKQSGR
jgi:hypothetical protein